MRIGFIDHHLNNYHANKFLGILRATPDVEIIGVWESDPTGDDWCEKNNVPRLESPQAVVDASDGIIVLAPDNIDAHLILAEQALKSGKPVYIDKLLASTVETARTIFEDADNHNTPIMSSSSLRFSTELEAMMKNLEGKSFDGLYSRGFGRWRGYAIHTVQPALRLLGGRVKRVIDTGSEKEHLITIENDQGKRAHVEIREAANQMQALTWQIGARTEDDNRYHIAQVKLFDEFYENMMKQVLEFFKTGKSSVPREEQLDAVAVEIAATKSFNSGNIWVDVATK